jgi:hypothetical protein
MNWIASARLGGRFRQRRAPAALIGARLQIVRLFHSHAAGMYGA